MANTENCPKVGIVMGSDSDMPVMAKAADILEELGIPYDELAELTAVKKDGGRIAIIKNGKFVLPGTEELNEPLQELS